MLGCRPAECDAFVVNVISMHIILIDQERKMKLENDQFAIKMANITIAFIIEIVLWHYFPYFKLIISLKRKIPNIHNESKGGGVSARARLIFAFNEKVTDDFNFCAVTMKLLSLFLYELFFVLRELRAKQKNTKLREKKEEHVQQSTVCTQCSNGKWFLSI